MPLSGRKLILIVPALLEQDIASLDSSSGHYSHLSRTLRQAKTLPSAVTSVEQALLWANGYGDVPVTGLPVAQCTYVADFSETPVNALRADPVYLRADTDHARLFSSYSLDLTEEESEQLLMSLNEHFADDGLLFSAGCRQRWYLSLLAKSGITQAALRHDQLDTVPTSIVSGRNVASFLPMADESRAWRQLMTEVQMLLHEHPVNLQRQAEGRSPVNSLWFFGGNALSRRSNDPKSRVFADDAFARGLAKLSGSSLYPTAEAAAAIGAAVKKDDEGQDSRSLVVCFREIENALLAGQNTREHDSLQQIDAVLRKAIRKIWRGTLLEMILLPCNGEMITLRRADLLRFWQRNPTKKR